MVKNQTDAIAPISILLGIDKNGLEVFLTLLRLFLKEWICMSVVTLDRLSNGHQPLQVLDFIFDLEYLISSEALHAKINPTSFLFGSRFTCAQP